LGKTVLSIPSSDPLIDFKLVNFGIGGSGEDPERSLAIWKEKSALEKHSNYTKPP